MAWADLAGAAVADYEACMPPAPFSHADLATVVRLAPLVSIDLIIRNAQGQVLLGLRTNEPAKGCYFVPGGSIRKNERLHEAFARILKDETNCSARFEDARLLGVYEHFYETNRFGETGHGTHYVALGYALTLVDTTGIRADNQHSALEWWEDAALIQRPFTTIPRPISAEARGGRPLRNPQSSLVILAAGDPERVIYGEHCFGVFSTKSAVRPRSNMG